MLIKDKIEYIRANVNILDVFKKFGEDYTLIPGRDRQNVICPFHLDSDPSMTIYVDSNSCYCWGCGKGGSVFDVAMLFFNNRGTPKSFREVLAWVEKEFKIQYPRAESALSAIKGKTLSAMEEKIAEKRILFEKIYNSFFIEVRKAINVWERREKTVDSEYHFRVILDYIYENGEEVYLDGELNNWDLMPLYNWKDWSMGIIGSITKQTTFV